MKSINLFIFCVLLSGISMSAQMLSPVKSNHKLSKEIVKKGDQITLLFTLDIAANWHVYSNIQNYEMGPLPATFAFERHSGYKLLGEVIPVGEKKEHEPVFDVDVNYFENTGAFLQKIKICSENPVVKGFYEYQVCNVRDGTCVLGTEDFEFKIQTIK